MIYKFSDIQPKEIIKGFKGKLVHGANSTIALWEVEEGAVLHEHSHVHEQTTQVLEGEFELVVEGEKIICRSGMIVIIPSNQMHSGRALTSCKILDTFSPRREEYM